MKRTLIVLVLGAVVALCLAVAYGSRDPMSARRPLPDPSPPVAERPRPDAPQSPRRPLAEPMLTDDPFDVAIPETPSSGFGTAFAVSSAGTWITARHVTAGCSRLTVDTPRSRQPGTLAYADEA